MSEYSINTKTRNRVNLVLFILSLFIGVSFEIIINIIAIKSIEGTIYFILFNLLILPSVGGIFELLRLWVIKDLWKRKFFSKLIGIPNLNGKWHVEGKSDFNGSTVFKGEIIIYQTLDKIKINGLFSNSKSKNTSTYLRIDEDGTFELSYYYESRPFGDAVNSMQIHNGFAILAKQNDDFMLGEYFTNRFRGNKGTLKLIKNGTTIGEITNG